MFWSKAYSICSLQLDSSTFPVGMLQVYTPAGRRMLPALKLSAPPVSLSSDGAWRLMVVCRDGSLRVWDLQALTTHLEISLLSLVAATPAGTAGLMSTSSCLCQPYSSDRLIALQGKLGSVILCKPSFSTGKHCCNACTCLLLLSVL